MSAPTKKQPCKKDKTFLSPPDATGVAGKKSDGELTPITAFEKRGRKCAAFDVPDTDAPSGGSQSTLRAAEMTMMLHG